MQENDCALYTIKEVSKILRVTPRLVYDLVNHGLLPAIKLGSLKVRHQDLADFLIRYNGFDVSDPENVQSLF